MGLICCSGTTTRVSSSPHDQDRATVSHGPKHHLLKTFPLGQSTPFFNGVDDERRSEARSRNWLLYLMVHSDLAKSITHSNEG
jgi:hypothetical protein